MKLTALLTLTVVLYLPVCAAGFVYEDHNFSDAIRSPLAGWQDPRLSIVHPRVLTDLSFAANAAIWPSARGYHVVNLALHLVVGALVYLLVTGWGTPTEGLLASAIALWHPLQSETVAYVGSGRGELLAAVCALAALVLAQRRQWILVTFAGLCAFAAKESAAAGLIVVLPLTAWWTSRFSRGLLLPLMTWLVSLLAIGGAFWVRTPHHWSVILGNSWLALTYLRHVAVPVGLSIAAERHDVGIAGLYAWAAGAVAVCLGQWGAGTRTLTWIFWSVVAWLAPRMLFPQLEPPHEHALYLPMVCLAIAAAHLAQPWITTERSVYV